MKDLKRYLWWDADTRILHANFQILVDYVERELAWMQLIVEDKVRWYHRWVSIRNARELALKYLHWEITQVGGEQGQSAQAIKDLYLWWKDERPSRKDPWDEFEEGQDAARAESQHEDEDTEKLTELISIRGWLWT
jgi:hypothetical protein